MPTERDVLLRLTAADYNAIHHVLHRAGLGGLPRMEQSWAALQVFQNARAQQTQIQPVVLTVPE